MSGETKKQCPCPHGAGCRRWQRREYCWGEHIHTVEDCRKALRASTVENKSLKDRNKALKEENKSLKDRNEALKKALKELLNDMVAPHGLRAPAKTASPLPRGKPMGQFLSPDSILSSDSLRRLP